MNTQPNPKLIGSFLVGFALVGGAYVMSNFGSSRLQPPAPIGLSSVASVRTPITVIDSDNNGIEDWRDEFVTTAPIIIDPEDTTPYTPPSTLTGQLGINFFQNYVYARGYGEFGRTDEEVIEDTIDVLTERTEYELYDTPDILILTDWSDQDIVNYANAAANAIGTNSLPELEGELFILQDILNRNNDARMSELQALANMYRTVRDETLALPVPAIFARQHLDLINAYNAIYHDIEAMTQSINDPAYTLMRLKRYEDDALGLGYALQNSYLGVEPYSRLFTASDPALLFTIFSPSNFKIQ